MFNFGNVGAVGSVDAVRGIDERKLKMQEQQPQVAFINTIFEGFNNPNSGSEAAFNA
ncbi:MAG: hypothetical protein ACI4SM_05445 [Candidatus Gastranaerophilaceae bacterium]